MLDRSCCKTSRQPLCFSALPHALCSRLGNVSFLQSVLYAFENSHSPTDPQLVTIYVLKIAKSADLIHFTTSVLSGE